MQYSLGCRLKNWLSYLALFALSLCIILDRCSCSIARSHNVKQPWLQENVPAIFAYGDSTMDTGNNNQLLTIVRCDHPPYGKDFADHKATGRFSNGRIPADLIADEFGVKKYLPAFLDPNLKESDLLTGVSFASSGSGYDPLTSQLLSVKSLEEQLEMFKQYIERVKGFVGVERTNFIVNNSISIVATGSCDIVNTYFRTPLRITQYNINAYTDFTLNFAISHFKELYKLGVRKIGVGNLGPIGCMPAQRTLAGGLSRECPKFMNEAAQLFNSKLKDELLYLSTKLPNSKLVYMDLYSPALDLILNNTHYGFEVVDSGCCGTGLIDGAQLCNIFSPMCEVDDKYLFWDSFHPTERAYQILVHQIVDKYSGVFS